MLKAAEERFLKMLISVFPWKTVIIFPPHWKTDNTILFQSKDERFFFHCVTKELRHAADELTVLTLSLLSVLEDWLVMVEIIVLLLLGVIRFLFSFLFGWSD